MSGPEGQGEMPWQELRATCGNKRTTPDTHRSGKGGRLIPGSLVPGGSEKCGLLVPEQWPQSKMGDLEMARRWLGSGGSPSVFGGCSACSCPYRGNQHPDHRNAMEDLDESKDGPSGLPE